MVKKFCKALALAAALAVTVGSVSVSAASAGKATTKSATEIYFLNFKPEIATQYNAIAAQYLKETGVTVKVVTAAAGTYEATLKSEIVKSDAPTIFQINGPVGYQNWKSYCANLNQTTLYKDLTDKSLAVKTGKNNIYGIPYTIEGYGIIYNNAIMKKYFALKNKKVKYTSVSQINDFAKLKAVVTDMTKNKSKLGIKGVFASTSLASGEQWRWQTHLLSIPMYYEFAAKKGYNSTVLAGLASPTIKFSYGKNYKNIFDLYLNNSTTKGALLGGKSVADSMAEFALGQCAMVQNGDWAWSQISGVKGNKVKSADIKMMPIYTGVSGEEKNGLCVGTENYFAINRKVSAAKQKASVAFLNWLFTSKEGKRYVTKSLGFIAPFSSFSASERPSDPLAKQVLSWMSMKGYTSVPWTFQCFPSEQFKNDVGSALLQYAQGSKKWSQVASVVKSAWKSEYANAKSSS